MFKKLLPLILVLSLTTSSFLFIAPKTAQASLDELNTIYCERRTGNQLNLETWYGGRCATGDTDLEQTIGFGDIIIIDLYEKLTGPGAKGDDDLEYLKNILEKLYGSKETSSLNGDSVLESLSLGITRLYQYQPASSVEYIADIKNNFNKNKPIGEVYAQNAGFGFNALNPIIPIWRNFRNLAYFIFILAFIYYGFMIMFRMKINPQTVMNIQLALPKLIITLLLITFSYAIAGLLIDTFYVLVGFIFSALTASSFLGSLSASGISGFNFGMITPMLWTFMHLFVGNLVGKIWLAILPVPALVGNILSHTVLAGPSLIIGLILIIALIYTFIKIFWMLLKAYVTIILNIIFSPIILLGNVLPGSTAFANWIKSIFAELSVFASVMVIFILAFYFMGPLEFFSYMGVPIFTIGGDIGPATGDDPLWVPPPLDGAVSIDSVQDKLTDSAVGKWAKLISTTYIGFPKDIDIPDSSAKGKFALIGLGMILMLPKLAEMIRNALKIKDLGYGSAIGAGLAAGFSPISAPARFAGASVKQQATQVFGTFAKPFISGAGRAGGKVAGKIFKTGTPPQPTT